MRKCLSAAKELEQESGTQITRVHQAQATTTKVSGLKISMRENYLTALIEALKANVKESEEDKPRSYLVQKDFEAVAADIEYECFSKQKVVNMYRHAVAKEVSSILNNPLERYLNDATFPAINDKDTDFQKTFNAHTNGLCSETGEKEKCLEWR